MTIHRKEEPDPTELPPARLYFDDVKEILHLLREAVKEPADAQQPTTADETLTTRIEVRDQVTDDLNDLPKIHPAVTRDLFLEIRGDMRNASVRITETYASLYTFALTQNGHLGLFHQLDALFQSKASAWRKLLHSHRAASNQLYGAATALLLVLMGAPFLLIRYSHPPWPTVAIGLLALNALFLIALRVGLRTHTVVSFRPRSEASALRREHTWKILPLLISAVLAILGTLLVQYVIHTIWSPKP